jgi:hypothetical protein
VSGILNGLRVAALAAAMTIAFVAASPGDAAALCQGFCDMQSPDSCFCDEVCEYLGDCCADKQVFCGPSCGNGNCLGGFEDTNFPCPADCPVGPICGDGICDPTAEGCETCPEDCGPCAPVGSCEGNCGGPATDPITGATLCFCDEVCEYLGDCCGDKIDFCGPSCGNGNCLEPHEGIDGLCPEDCPIGPICGDGTCDPTAEGCETCPEDCGPCAPVGSCEGNCGGSAIDPITGGTLCFCDEVCEYLGDCCGDKIDFCGPSCGNGNCLGGFEDANFPCPEDCPVGPICGDGICDPTAEGCENCAADCGPCAPVGSCEGNCGGPAIDPITGATLCFCDEVCEYLGDCCDDKVDFCGPSCGNGNCLEPHEGIDGLCPEDCPVGPICGDGICDPTAEGCETCPEDCGPCDPGCGNCSTAHGALGCDDAECTDIICAIDPFCCNNSWDGICANEALSCCPACGGDAGAPGCQLGPICGDGTCDPFAEGCDSCPEDCGPCGPICGDGICDPTAEGCGNCPEDCGPCPFEGDCCAANGTPGCDDAACTDAVCAIDPFCCDNSWDGICADEAVEFCPDICTTTGPVCGDGICDPTAEGCDNCPEDCGPCGFGGDCCASNGTPGCDDPACTDAVCAIDPFCCDTQWDGICADEAITECPDLCGGGDPCGDGICDETFEDCSSCPADCGECPPDAGDCCSSSGGLGCDDDICTDCVCAIDGFCCETAWDGICADEATADCAYDCYCANICDVAGDLTGDGVSNVVDVQCAIQAALAIFTGSALPACMPNNTGLADQDCSGTFNVVDVQIAIVYALGGGLYPSIDADGNNCPDSCDL